MSQEGLTAGERDWSYPCAASKGAPSLAERQNAEIRTIISEAGNGMRVIPFHALTTGREQLMMGRMCQFREAKPCADCTHFCWSPTLWAAFADLLNKALSEK